MRGALFSALEALGADFSRVLDLYAGTGALGIEALSRGAQKCDFVERDRGMAEVIRGNLEATGFGDRAKVYLGSVERVIDRLDGDYSLVLADPSYDDPAAIFTLERVAQSTLVDEDSVVVYEHSARGEAPGTLGPFSLARQLRHGDSALSIYASVGAGTTGG